MSRLVLVRHGEAAAGWGDAVDTDPGLSARGRAQALAMADALAPLGPLPVVVSPLRRTRETAAALEERWGTPARVDPAVGEVPSPASDDRFSWLAQLLTTPFTAWPSELQAWRRSVVDTLCALPGDSVVVTHYVAITAAAGVAGYMPDYCSRTVVETGPDGLHVVELGAERATVVR